MEIYIFLYLYISCQQCYLIPESHAKVNHTNTHRAKLGAFIIFISEYFSGYFFRYSSSKLVPLSSRLRLPFPIILFILFLFLTFYSTPYHCPFNSVPLPTIYKYQTRPQTLGRTLELNQLLFLIPYERKKFFLIITSYRNVMFELILHRVVILGD